MILTAKPSLKPRCFLPRLCARSKRKDLGELWLALLFVSLSAELGTLLRKQHAMALSMDPIGSSAQLLQIHHCQNYLLPSFHLSLVYLLLLWEMLKEQITWLDSRNDCHDKDELVDLDPWMYLSLPMVTNLFNIRHAVIYIHGIFYSQHSKVSTPISILHGNRYSSYHCSVLCSRPHK